ncbi:MAG: hypothetical protein Q9187_007729 [Circinaria calcarea]
MSNPLPPDPPPNMVRDNTGKSEDANSTWNGHFWTILALSAVMLILDTSNYISMAPETAILEHIVCGKYYASLGIFDGKLQPDKCKIEPVQSEVAIILGWKDALDTIPGGTLLLPKRCLDSIGLYVRLCPILPLFVQPQEQNVSADRLM